MAEPSWFYNVAQLLRPAGVLAPAEDGAVALGLRRGPDLGGHHPVAHRIATSPAPPPSPSIRFMTRVPTRAMAVIMQEALGA
jgi:hypothetical protein